MQYNVNQRRILQPVAELNRLNRVRYGASPIGIDLWRYRSPMAPDVTVMLCRHSPVAYRHLTSELHHTDRQHARRLNPERRRDWVIGRWLAYKSLRAVQADGPTPRIRYDAVGSPFIQSMGRPRPSISFSHTRDWSAVAIALRRRVGVDIEAGVAMDAEHACYFLRPAEISVFSSTDSYPLNTWVMKEAAFKAMGRGEHLLFKDMRLIPQSSNCSARVMLSVVDVSAGVEHPTGMLEFYKSTINDINIGLAIL